MSISTTFIERPVATTLLTLGVVLSGAIGLMLLPVAPLPQVDFPTISVQATLPGASPEVVANSVATPLERHLGVIADVSEMTSSSTVGSARVTLQFGLDRDIDGAARDVQAAINAARADLPASLRSNPVYRKVNPADAPIMVLSLTSPTLSRGQIFDAASSVLQQKFSQVPGIGQVTLSGSALPAVRVELNPRALSKYGISLEDVRAALASANAHAPKGALEGGGTHWQIYDNDQASHAADYAPLVVAWRNNAAVHLSDVAEVDDSVENIRNDGLADGKPAVLVILYRQPGANIISTVDQVRQALPFLRASIPPAIDLQVAVDRSTTIRASLKEIERSALLAIALVVGVVFLFLRTASATLVPAVVVPASLIGTFGIMYLCGYSLDNLSLMALTIAAGFVMDDAIVVMENITRHVEAGMPRMQAAVLGAREVGFTVVSMSLSLIAVFTPILLMGGIVGRLFREFGVTLSIAILMSMVFSLTLTPMICARLPAAAPKPSRWPGAMERWFTRWQQAYARSLAGVVRHPVLVAGLQVAVSAIGVALFLAIPKGFFPQEDTGQIVGGIQADQSISFQLMRTKLHQFSAILQKDPAMEHVVGFTGGGQANSGFMFASLKPRDQRADPADRVIQRLSRQLSQVPGASLFLQSTQDIRMGGRQSNAQYQFTLQDSDLAELYAWAPRILQALQRIPMLTQVNSDLQQGGLQVNVGIDRLTAARLGVTTGQIDNTLYDAFGQRQVSTIYNPLNQYHVVMEVAPQYWQDPAMLQELFVSTAGGSVGGTQATNAIQGTVSSRGQPGSGAAVAQDAQRNLATNQITASGKGAVSTGAAVSVSRETMVPLAAVTRSTPGRTPLAVNHHGPFVASTISFNLVPGASLSDAVAAVRTAMAQLGVPASVHGDFQGTARAFQQSLASQPYLVAAALAAIYIVLGVLYESTLHPITIMSTLPSAGVGAIVALLLFRMEFSLFALIGVFLLIGLVKKNAIMMIDFALHAQRHEGLAAHDAILQACALRFRPIMMTTVAAMLGAVPLALSRGEGAELRHPLGITIIGGLLLSQLLTLYTTPVTYLLLERARVRLAGWRRRWSGAPGAAVGTA
ncbi:efflux RND transporter permease subunit [Ramlibacter humi]|uniref:Nodulation protein n=1 Tax=Ramlibacter humi TaxID=2530451 RepID=A0A4Z0BTM1_9BURK|nr:efflux RND transporter permease subunit [Ramlibacter humi]TFZ01760.1 nodulation protein [Ramlibacter humi]